MFQVGCPSVCPVLVNATRIRDGNSSHLARMLILKDIWLIWLDFGGQRSKATVTCLLILFSQEDH